MIISCNSCSRKFIVRDQDIPQKGRTVQCGYCSVMWFQLPVSTTTQPVKTTSKQKPISKARKNITDKGVKASDGKNYKPLGNQWAQLLPSGKTGIFATKKISKELNKLVGKIETETSNKEFDPFSESLGNETQLPDIYKPKQKISFLTYTFLLIIIGFSIVGVLITFEDSLVYNFPEIKYIFDILNKQIDYFSETIRNMFIIINDLLDSY
jgi:predicted Zn finger-like uncharacterized protein